MIQDNFFLLFACLYLSEDQSLLLANDSHHSYKNRALSIDFFIPFEMTSPTNNTLKSEEMCVPPEAAVYKAEAACESFITSLKPQKRKRSPAVVMKIKSARGGERLVLCADRDQADLEKTRLEQMHAQEKLDIFSRLCPLIYMVRDDLPPPLKQPRYTAIVDDLLTCGSDATNKRAHAVTCLKTKKTLPRLLVSSRHARLSSDSCLVCCTLLVEAPMTTETPCCHYAVCMPCVEALSSAWCARSHRKMVLMVCVLCGRRTLPNQPEQLLPMDSLAARYVLMFWDMVSKLSPKCQHRSAVKVWRSIQEREMTDHIELTHMNPEDEDTEAAKMLTEKYFDSDEWSLL